MSLRRRERDGPGSEGARAVAFWASEVGLGGLSRLLVLRAWTMYPVSPSWSHATSPFCTRSPPLARLRHGHHRPLGLILAGHPELRQKGPGDRWRPCPYGCPWPSWQHGLQQVGVDRPVFTDAAIAFGHEWAQGSTAPVQPLGASRSLDGLRGSSAVGRGVDGGGGPRGTPVGGPYRMARQPAPCIQTPPLPEACARGLGGQGAKEKRGQLN